MKLALIFSDLTERMRGLRSNLMADFSVIVGRSVRESLDLLQTLPVDLALVDLDSDGARAPELPERIRECRPHCAVVAVLPAEGAGEGMGLTYDAALRADASVYEISAALTRVMERQRLLEEIEQQRAEIRRLQARSERLQAAQAPTQPVDKLIKAFSRALSSGFDLERLLNLFADTMLEMMRVSKVSVLLQGDDPDQYRVRCFRGLRPDIAEGLCLRANSGLAAWLAREGRIMTRGLCDGPGISPEVGKEMDVLQAVVSIPMMCSGMLVGVLNLNGRVTGSAFLEDELETLFTLAGHMAVAVQDMGVIRQIRHQKSYVDQVMANMECGVVAIDMQERVVLCNASAAAIVGKKPEDLMHRDLRQLPSPLGDMLYETLCTGYCHHNEEVLALPARIPLEVSTYRLLGADGQVLGSSAIFQDLRPRKELEGRRRDSERVEIMRRVVGGLAAEIREPLLRQTEASAAGGDDGREHAGAAEVLRRVEALEAKVAAFMGRLDCRFEAHKLRDLVTRAVKRARAEGMPEDVTVVTDGVEEANAAVRADSAHLPQALGYLLRYAANHTSRGGTVALQVDGEDGANPLVDVQIRYTSAAPAADVQCLLDPIGLGEEEQSAVVDLGLPASRRIIEEHGGMLSASAGKEREVCITLRLRQVESEASAEHLDARRLQFG